MSDRSPGKPTKCTPEITRAVADLLRKGNYVTTAVRTIGIGVSTHYQWIERANEVRLKIDNGGEPEGNEQAYVEYAEAIDLASADGEVFLTQQLLNAATPRIVSRVTETIEPVIYRGSVLTHPQTGEPWMVTRVHRVEWEEFDWRAALEILKRRFPENWGDKLAAKLSGSMDVRGLPQQPVDDEEIRRMVDAAIESGLDPKLLLDDDEEQEEPAP